MGLAQVEKEFLPHIDSLYNFATFLQHDEEIAKDLLQETYLRAYKFINIMKKEPMPRPGSLGY